MNIDKKLRPVIHQKVLPKLLYKLFDL